MAQHCENAALPPALIKDYSGTARANLVIAANESLLMGPPAKKQFVATETEDEPPLSNDV